MALAAFSRYGGAAVRPPVEALESRTLFATTYVPIAGVNDVVYDFDRNLVYITTGGGTIQRYDVGSGVLLAPWTVGGNLLGADITADGAFLYVADGSNPQVRKVDLSNGSSTAIPFTRADLETNAYDVAVLGSRAIFTTRFAGSGDTPLRQIDLATGAVSVRPDVPLITQDGILSRAGDRSGMFLTESNISSGPLRSYDAALDRFTAYAETNTFHTNTFHDVNSDGNLIALRMGSDVRLYTDELGVVGTVAGLNGGLRFAPAGDMLYGVKATTDELIGYDTAARVQRFALPLGRDFAAGAQFGSGMMAVGANRAFVSDNNGILVVDLPEATGRPARFQTGGFYTFVRRGVAGTVRVQALDRSGRPDTGYLGTVRLTTTDFAATLPPAYTFTAADNGYVELPVTLNTPGTHTIFVADTSGQALTGQVTQVRVHAGNAGLIPVTDRRDHAFDARRKRLYITTSRGAIEQYDLGSEALLEPLQVGVDLYGIDVSVNGRWLMAQEGASPSSGGEYLKIDLDRLDAAGRGTDYLTRIGYTFDTNESGGWDVAATGRGTFLADSRRHNSGWAPVREVDPATNTTAVVEVGLVRGQVKNNTGIARSPDGRYHLFTESGVVDAPLTVYDTVAGQRLAGGGTSQALSGEPGAVNRDGTLFAARVGINVRIYNRSLQEVRSIQASGGVAFDPAADLIYIVDVVADEIDVYRTGDWTAAGSVPIGENVPTASAMDDGTVTVAVAGGSLFLSTPSGLRVVALGTRALPGNYAVAEGRALNLSGGAYAAPGRTITSYEWDFNYDGATFTRDAAGQNVAMPTAGLDGPSTRQVALRVTDSTGASDVGVTTVDVVNAPPLLRVSGPGVIGVGQTLTLDLSAADPGPDTVTSWTVDWGEGPVQTLGGGASVSVSRALEVEGLHTVVVTATDEDGNHRAAPFRVLVSTPPTVQSAAYAYDAAPPAVRVRFSENVGPSVDRDDFIIVNRTTGQTVPAGETAVGYDAATQTATVTFPGFPGGVIPNGNYRVTVLAPGVRDGIDNALDGNGDGVAGDDAAGEFFVLAGDVNRDRAVNGSDFALLAANFGRTGRTYGQGDLNGDGSVNGTDFAVLAGNFGRTVPEPAAIATTPAFVSPVPVAQKLPSRTRGPAPRPAKESRSRRRPIVAAAPH